MLLLGTKEWLGWCCGGRPGASNSGAGVARDDGVSCNVAVAALGRETAGTPHDRRGFK